MPDFLVLYDANESIDRYGCNDLLYVYLCPMYVHQASVIEHK